LLLEAVWFANQCTGLLSRGPVLRQKIATCGSGRRKRCLCRACASVLPMTTHDYDSRLYWYCTDSADERRRESKEWYYRACFQVLGNRATRDATCAGLISAHCLFEADSGVTICTGIKIFGQSSNINTNLNDNNVYGIHSTQGQVEWMIIP
jgi:hypothetical protein